VWVGRGKLGVAKWAWPRPCLQSRPAARVFYEMASFHVFYDVEKLNENVLKDLKRQYVLQNTTAYFGENGMLSCSIFCRRPNIMLRTDLWSILIFPGAP